MRRSKRELGGQSPQFLVRTGSLKTRSMMEREEKREGGNTCYMLQSGCYLWTGRWVSHHIQFSEKENKKRERKKKDF